MCVKASGLQAAENVRNGCPTHSLCSIRQLGMSSSPLSSNASTIYFSLLHVCVFPLENLIESLLRVGFVVV